ncbi:MAG: nitrile hydratase subunit beta [Burkholderiales bacterium]|nr:nitrile hydratase subunit beta [Burkholderiales bacterium]
MNSVHDLGGVDGFGPVVREGNDASHHYPWEERLHAIHYLMGRTGVYNTDEFRFAKESMSPVHYLAASYYERTLFALVTKLAEKGLLSEEEVRARARQHPHNLDRDLARGATPPGELQRFFPLRRNLPRVSVGTPARFGPGARVLTRNLNPKGHTRLPRYARGRRGVVDRVHGPQAFADTRAHGLGDQPQYLYSVRFDGRELWGEHADPKSVVHLDLWESYLEPLLD